MKPLAILVPTRSRPHNIRRLLDDLHDTHTTSTVILGVDRDDPALKQYQALKTEHPHYKNTQLLVMGKRKKVGMVAVINTMISKVLHDFQHFAFIGDDTKPRSPLWDQATIQALNTLGTGIVYWNDLHYGKDKPTHWAVTGDIVRTWGKFAPSTLTHLYVDDFYQQFGQDLGSFHYLPDVVMEHLHAIYGKAPYDEQYQQLNAPDVYLHDEQALRNFLASSEYKDLVLALKHHQEGKRK